MKILFVWDFHGTLEKNNVKAVQEIINKVLKRFGIEKEISFKEAVDLYGLSWIDYFKYIYPEGELNAWKKMKRMTEEIQNKDNVVEKYIKPMDHAREVLSVIRAKGHLNIILSNCQPNLIEYFVGLVGLTEFFEKFIAADTPEKVREHEDVSRVKFQ